jgi:hypothetical protein
MTSNVRTALALSLIAVLLGGCNQHVSVTDTPTGPTQTLPPATPAQPRIASVEIDPGAVLGGESATGIVRLTGPAQAPGLFVSMSSSDDVASVPAQVGIPAGSTFVRFGVRTQRVEGDRRTVISASTPDSTVTMPFEVWMVDAPFFFSFMSYEDDPVGRAEFGRFIPSTATFSAACNGNQVRINISAPGRDPWSLTFKAAGNKPLERNRFEAHRIGLDEFSPGMDIVAGGRSCEAIYGHFEITELDVSNNRVNLLRGEFRQECISASGVLQGEFRVENMPAGTSANCLR